jgi:hypothetical protein
VRNFGEKKETENLLTFLIMKSIVYLKYLLFLIPTILISCCKYDYNLLKISNNTDMDKYIIAYAVEDGQNYIVSGKEKVNEEFNKLSAYGKTELILTGEESFILERKPNEKNLILYFYISEKESKNKLLKNSTIKKYSFEELENQNWNINFDGN